MSEQTPSRSTPRFILSTEGELYGEDTPENREIVRRIHACVAACEGISTDELEKGIVRDMQRVIGEIAPLLEKANGRQGPRCHIVDAQAATKEPQIAS